MDTNGSLEERSQRMNVGKSFVANRRHHSYPTSRSLYQQPEPPFMHIKFFVLPVEDSPWRLDIDSDIMRL